MPSRQSENPSTRCRARTHERYSSFVGDNEYIQANGGRGQGTVSGKDVNRVGRGFVVDGMYIPRNTLHCVAQRQSSLHPHASVDRQPASEHRVSIRGVYCVIMDAR